LKEFSMTTTADGNAGKTGDGNQPKQAGSARPTISPEDAARITEMTKRISTALGEIVSVLLRAPAHRHLFLADLEWLVLPALATGQFALAEARHEESGLAAPVAVMLWATVSAEVDARLTANVDKPVRLKPDEWAAGPNAWLVEAVGEPRAVKALIDETLRRQLKGRGLKVRTRGADGKPALQLLTATDPSPPASAPAGA
jgi:hemolysin-activating ACP:hemolysin acyltransferase